MEIDNNNNNNELDLRGESNEDETSPILNRVILNGGSPESINITLPSGLSISISSSSYDVSYLKELSLNLINEISNVYKIKKNSKSYVG